MRSLFSAKYFSLTVKDGYKKKSSSFLTEHLKRVQKKRFQSDEATLY